MLPQEKFGENPCRCSQNPTIASRTNRPPGEGYDRGGKPRWLNPAVGRRYLPANVGYALVKSGTADLFALRLKRTGSLVAFQVLPNPDIPEDWNVLHEQ